MTDQTIQERISKLLALTESPNENEATLAAEKAQELMLKWLVMQEGKFEQD